jgi:uncharacterized protein
MRLPVLLFATAFAFASAGIANAQKSVDPAALAQAKSLLEKSGAAALGQQMERAVIERQRVSLEQANPGRTTAINEMLALMDVEFTKQLPTMMDAIAGIYALHFNAEELGAIGAFYDSPVGSKMVKEMPTILSESVTVAQAFGQQIATEVLRALKSEFEKRNLKLSPSKT